MKQLFSIIPFKFTGDDLGEIKKANRKASHANLFIPEICLRSDTGMIDDGNHYLQWVDSGEQTYYLFTIDYVDALLKQEIEDSGLERTLPFNFKPLFDKIGSYTAKDRTRILLATHIVVDVTYRGNFEDVECDIEVLGFLDENLELQKVQLERIE